MPANSIFELDLILKWTKEQHLYPLSHIKLDLIILKTKIKFSNTIENEWQFQQKWHPFVYQISPYEWVYPHHIAL